MYFKFFGLPALFGALITLTACSVNPIASSVSLNGEVLLREWRCDSADARIVVERPDKNGIAPSLADKLLQCPFHRDYQIEAMRRDAQQTLDHKTLSEIVYKIRWGIDFQYRQYEEVLQSGPKRKYFIPRILNRVSPGLADLFQLGTILQDDPIKVGRAAPIVVRQMQHDRRETGAELDRRLAALAAGKGDYPLWQAMIDLDAYFVAGTAGSALESLDKALTSDRKTQSPPIGY
jgi:hypothetical protein